MKTIFFSLLLFPVVLNAQITVTQNDFGSAGDTVRFSIAQDIWGLDAALSGANVTWDFSVMEPTVQKIDTLFTTVEAGFTYAFVYANPTDPSHMSSWNRKEQAIDFGGLIPVEDFRGFYKKSSTALSYVGAGAKILGFPLPAKADTIDKVYRLPMNFGDAYNEVRYLKADIPNLFYFEQHMTIQNEVEGWGTLITPFGSFQTLKIKKIINEFDSIYADTLGFGFGFNQPQRVEYHWIGENYKLPLMVYSDLGITGNIEYQDIARSGTPVLSVSDEEIAELSLYPNPASDLLTITSSEIISMVRIVDMNGKQIATYPVNSTQASLDVNSISNGLYLVEILSEQSVIPTKRPLVIVR